ncbi:MAG: class I SAM-dependent methyltransferase [Saprospirales bacterium]|nr:class I SAM-dependent methyltransferase [Saprospirales bacterium]MBK7334860.1 class I SAM-dependent methyltransferase [Saprospirales bacterium]
MSATSTIQDKSLWNSNKVIQEYATADYLSKPEQTILQGLKPSLPGMRMLDLGIGGGRTTLHFAPHVKEYVGSDYAENMIDACLKRFPNPEPNTRFEVIDARKMSGVPDGYYDLVLFSFNGLDSVPTEDRHKVLEEVKRVGKPGGQFVFSSHNLRYIRKMYALKLHKQWRVFLYQFYRTFMLIYYNGLPSKYDQKDYAVLRNGAEHFSLDIYYGKPEFQVRQLQEAGFRNIRAFSLRSGEEIKADKLRQDTEDAWIYYQCEI